MHHFRRMVPHYKSSPKGPSCHILLNVHTLLKVHTLLNVHILLKVHTLLKVSLRRRARVLALASQS